MAFITTSGTLDKKSESVRRYLAARCDLIGAVRLPNNTFTAQAGTTVTYFQFLAVQDIRNHRYLVVFSTHSSGLTLGNSLGTFRHKQDSTLVAEQTTIFSVSIFLRVNI